VGVFSEHSVHFPLSMIFENATAAFTPRAEGYGPLHQPLALHGGAPAIV